MKKSILVLSLFIALSACSNSPSVDEAATSITKENLLSRVEVLASDEFLGRSTGTEGEQKAVDYLVAEFKAMGATSGVEDGSYIQKFPLVGQKTSNHTMSFSARGKSTIRGDFFTDFVSWPSDEATQVDIKNAELVYVGYGIQAPEENWDDFKEVDVAGKIIVIKNNDPEYDENLFGGRARLFYGRYTYKYEKAKEMGALGAIIIHTTETAGYGWNVVSNGWSRERFNVKGSGGGDSQTKLSAWITYETSDKLFSMAGLNVDDQLAAADSPDFKPVSLGRVRMNASLDAEYRDINAQNVLGVVEGSDPDLKDEYLVLTAHFDHLGITASVDGDSLNNGAEDNAAGVSALLEMMKAYKSIQPELKRSVLGLVVSAEEVGLLGSKYWAENPTVAPGKVSANINLDGTNVYGETEDVVIIGYGRNSVADLVVEQAKKEGRTVKPDPKPENGIFYRSDHFNMAKVGIPAIFPNPGTDFVGKDKAFSAKMDSVSGANYHTVNDEINKYWDLSGAEKDAQLFFKVGYTILNAPSLQKWNAGDEFEATRLKSLEK